MDPAAEPAVGSAVGSVAIDAVIDCSFVRAGPRHTCGRGGGGSGIGGTIGADVTQGHGTMRFAHPFAPCDNNHAPRH
ncbi:hypothetical protein GCM10010440_29460 [Kitasatospora cinereorecta]